jgi:hypothetical protein
MRFDVQGYFIVMLLKPIAAVVFFGLFYGFIWLVWKYMPESRVKRLLFKSWGEDNGPWVAHYRRTTVTVVSQEQLPAPSLPAPQNRQAESGHH